MNAGSLQGLVQICGREIDNKGAESNHQINCSQCAEWLFYNDKVRFDKLLAKAVVSKKFIVRAIVKIAIAKGLDLSRLQDIPQKINIQYIPDRANVKYIFQTEDVQSIAQKTDIASEIVRSCKAYELSSVLIELPVTAGVYIVAIHSEKCINFAYIGSSKSIRDRFKTHHLKEQFHTLVKAGVEVYVYCLLFPLQESEPAMRQTEDFLIKELKPKLNSRIPK